MTDRLLVLVGTKAQYIKTAPILRELDARGIGYRLVYTGQHSETFDELERAFGTRPADDVMVPGNEAATHMGFAGWSLRYWLAAFKRISRREWSAARLSMVHGDTASTLFGALASRLAGTRVVHVEAGLRSPRWLEPFPEEIIRRIVSRLSSVHYVPDQQAAANLATIGGEVVDTQGNTLRDALVMALGRLRDLNADRQTDPYAIVSIHRSENLAHSTTFRLLMEEVMHAASVLPIKFVLHPVTRARLKSSDWLQRLQQIPGLELLERMDHPRFVELLIGARFLMTDGGSNQEEAAMLGMPTLLLRRATERPDGLGQSVVLSNLQRDAIREFVANHANQTWVPDTPRGQSPSKILVDHLQPLLT